MRLKRRRGGRDTGRAGIGKGRGRNVKVEVLVRGSVKK
jgi:hypothetical protein